MSNLYTLPGHLIRRLQQSAVSLFAARMSEAGLDLTPVQYAVMVTVQDNPDIDQATLAGLIAYDRVTIGGVVDRLVAKDLIRREISPRDRRARVLSLTDEGVRVIERAIPWVDRVQADIIEGLTDDERQTFSSLLVKLTETGNQRSRAPLKDLRQN